MANYLKRLILRYVLSGGTSKTGNTVAERLAQRFGADAVTCLVRAASDTAFLRDLGARLHIGDITEPATYRSILSPEIAFIDMSRIRFTHHALPILVESGVTRAYFVSTTAIYSRFQAMNALYLENEAKIRASGLTYTILRPSMIYGSPRDKNMHKLIRALASWPVFPLFGGDSLMQPVFLDDLAETIVRAIGDEKTANAEYDLAGPEPLTYRAVVQTVLRELNRKTRIVEVPARLAERAASLGERIPGFPVKLEQVQRLREDKAFDISKARRELDYQPRAFADGIRAEISAMRAAGLIP